MAIRSILQLWGSSYKHTYTHNRRDIFVVHSIRSNAMTSDLALRKPQGHLSGSRSSYSPWKQGQTLDGCPEHPWKLKVKSFGGHLHLKSPQIWNMKLSGRKITCHHSVNYAVCKLLLAIGTSGAGVRRVALHLQNCFWPAFSLTTPPGKKEEKTLNVLCFPKYF